MCRVGPWLDGGCVRRLIAENRLWPHATRKEIWSSYRAAVTIGYVACVFVRPGDLHGTTIRSIWICSMVNNVTLRFSVSTFSFP